MISLQSKGLWPSPAPPFKSIDFQHPVFFMAQLSHPYMTVGKTVTFTVWIYILKVMSLLFNMLSRFIIAFFPRSKCLLISWLQSLSIVTLEPKEIKSVTTSTFSPSICHEVMRLDTIILVCLMLSFKSAFSLFHPHQEAL